MRSMTGYGKGIAEENGRKFTVELRSVNHKYLDVATKLPRILVCCEETIKKTFSATLKRGHVDVFVTYEDYRQGKNTVTTDYGMVDRYIAIAKEMEKKGLSNDLTVTTAMKLPEVLTLQGEEDDEEEIKSLAKKATAEAVANLVKMRDTEGALLKKDFLSKFDYLERIVDGIEARAPEVSKLYATRLRESVVEFLNSDKIDETRIMTEIALFVDKVNIDEEITRLRSHIAHGREIINENGAIGRKLEFIIQEIFREVNTTGSKANDLKLTELVLEGKNLIEMLREQIQNVE